jgi:hypothetical protein
MKLAFIPVALSIGRASAFGSHYAPEQKLEEEAILLPAKLATTRKLGAPTARGSILTSYSPVGFIVKKT